MKKLKIFLFIFLLFSFLLQALLSMKITPKKELTSKEVIEEIVKKSIQYFLNNTNPKPFINWCINNCPEELKAAYPDIPPGTFKNRLNKIIKKNIKIEKRLEKEITTQILTHLENLKTNTNCFCNWLKEIQDQRKRYLIISKTVEIIELCFEKFDSTNINELFTLTPEGGILKTIIRIISYKTTNKLINPVGISSLYDKHSLLQGYLNYTYIFSGCLSTQPPPLKLVFELAPHIYDNFFLVHTLLLNGNNLKNLPETIACLPNLVEIQLQNNNLKALPFDAILSITTLKNLIIDTELYNQLPTNFLNELGKRKVNIETR